MPKSNNSKDANTKNNPPSIHDARKFQDITPEMLENLQYEDAPQITRLFLDSPEAKTLKKLLKHLQEASKLTGTQFTVQLKLGNQSLREISEGKTDKLNKDALLNYTVISSAIAANNDISVSFTYDTANPAWPERTVDLSHEASLGLKDKAKEKPKEKPEKAKPEEAAKPKEKPESDKGILATILEFLSNVLNLFRSKEKIDELRTVHLRESYLEKHAADYQNLAQELEKAKDTKPDQSLVNEICNDIKTVLQNDEKEQDSKKYSKETSPFTRIFNPEITKKLLHAAPLLKEITLENILDIKNTENRFYTALAKFQFDLLENNIKCYEAVKNKQLDKISEAVDSLDYSHAWLKYISDNRERVLRFDNQLTSASKYIGSPSCKDTRVNSPISTALLISDAAFKQELNPLSTEIRIVPHSLNKKAEQFCLSANEEAAKKMASKAPKKEEIKNSAPEMSGPVA